MQAETGQGQAHRLLNKAGPPRIYTLAIPSHVPKLIGCLAKKLSSVDLFNV